MAFPDPQSVTLASAISLPRVKTDASSAEYAAGDRAATLKIKQETIRGRRRSYLQLSRRKISTDVLTDVKSYTTAWISVTLDRPEVAFTEVELLELVSGITTWLTTGTNANAKRVLGQES